MWSKKRIVWFVLMIFTMAVIFYFSNQSGEKSDKVGNAVAQSMNIAPKNECVDESHTKLLLGLNLRKWAHVGLFGALGFWTYGWLLSVREAISVCFVFSVLDEIHQIFVPGRDARGMDILIDAAGFMTMILISIVVRWLINMVFEKTCWKI